MTGTHANLTRLAAHVLGADSTLVVRWSEGTGVEALHARSVVDAPGLLGHPSWLEAVTSERRAIASDAAPHGALAVAAGARSASGVVLALGVVRVASRPWTAAELATLAELAAASLERDLGSIELLADTCTALTMSSDRAALLEQFVQAIVPRFADACVVLLPANADGAPAHVTVAHARPEHATVLREMLRYHPLRDDAPHGSPFVARGGAPGFVADAGDELLRAITVDADQITLLRELGVRSWISVPVALHARAFGVVSFVAGASDRRYVAGDVPLAVELAGRVATALAVSDALAVAQRERTRAQQASRAKDAFLAMVSHELRTPLDAVLGWTRLLRAGGLDDARTAHALEVVERNAQLEAHLVEDLLDVSRMVAGKLRLDVRAFELHAVVAAAIDAVRPLADASGVRIQPILDPNAGPIAGDPDRLQQVVWNLLTNAIRFTPRGGRVQVQLRRNTSYVEIHVLDSGRGIAPDLLGDVFEPYRQGAPTETTGWRGMGLGLSIARQLVELHGGTLTARSEGEGRGSSFVVRLPLAVMSADTESLSPAIHPSATAASPAFDCPPELDGLAVLVVDDEVDARELLATTLERCGSNVRAVGSASEALAAMAAERFDVLVSDIGLGDGDDGYALMRAVRALPPERGGRIPAAALTAYARAEDRTRALLAGFNVHVPKPIEPAELVAVVGNLAGRAGRG